MGVYWVYEQMSWVYLEYGHITRGYQPLLGAMKATDFLNKLLRVHIPSENYIYIFFFLMYACSAPSYVSLNMPIKYREKFLVSRI